MKRIFLKITVVFSILAVCSCNQKKATENLSTGIEKTESTAVEVDSDKVLTKTIEGNVVQINNGKDGYTAKIKTNDDGFYFVTISHSNLKDASQYKTVKQGDFLKVTGDYWKMQDENQITVRSID